MREKLKSLLLSDHSFYSLLVLIAGWSGFMLADGEVVKEVGQTYALEANSEQKKPESWLVAEPWVPKADISGLVVGSKSGTKYHLPSCPGAAQIKPENRVEFATIALAEAAGYKPASNCPGLVQ